MARYNREIGPWLARRVDAKGKTRKEIAEYLAARGLSGDEGNLSRMFNGERSMPDATQQAIAGLLRVELPPKTPGMVPVASLKALPMGLSGDEMASALRLLTERRLPDMTGDEGLFYVQLTTPSGGYKQGAVIFVAPKRKLEPGCKVLADVGGHRFVGDYQMSPSGSQVADSGIAHQSATILGRVVGQLEVEGLPPLE